MTHRRNHFSWPTYVRKKNELKKVVKVQTKKAIIFSIRNIRKLAICRLRLLLTRSLVTSEVNWGRFKKMAAVSNLKGLILKHFSLSLITLRSLRPQRLLEATFAVDLARRSRERRIASFLIFLMEKIIVFLVCTLTTFFHSFFSYVCRSPSDMKEAISSTSNNFNLLSTAVEVYQKRMLLGWMNDVKPNVMQMNLL